MVANCVNDEFGSVNFGDQRVETRLKIRVTQAAGMGKSTPDRSKSSADLQATYRLVSNPKVSMSEIYSCHNQATGDRCSTQTRVYLCQDTTEVELTKPKQAVRGAGPLGVIDQVVWTRDPASLEVPTEEREAERQKACFEEKESYRWLEMMQNGEQNAGCLPGVQFVMVADSESEIGELLCEAPDLASNYNFIIRQCHQHSITSAVDSHIGDAITADTVDEALTKASWRSERVVQVGGREESVLPADKKRIRKQARISREVTLSLRAIRVTIAGPRRSGGGSLPDVSIHVIEAVERNPPEGEFAIRWVLFTTLPIATVDGLFEVLGGSNISREPHVATRLAIAKNIFQQTNGGRSWHFFAASATGKAHPRCAS